MPGPPTPPDRPLPPPATPERVAAHGESEHRDDVFDLQYDAHIDAATLERALETLLERYPEAPVTALRADAVMVDMPASIKLRDNPVLEARSGLDLIIHDEAVLNGWDRTLTIGAARYPIHPTAYPTLTSTLYALDLRENHGIILTLSVFVPPAISEDPSDAPEIPKPAPRFASLSKDERSVIIKADEAIVELLGWSAEELIGSRTVDFLHPDDRALAIDNWMEMLASRGPGRRVRLRHRRRDGTWVWFEVTNHNLLEDPKHGCVVCEIVDISDEMAAQEELRAREQLLDRLAEAIPMGLFQVDAERNVVYTNDRLHEILEVDRAHGGEALSVDAQLASLLASDRPILEQGLTDVLGAGLAADVEVHLRLPLSGEQRLCSINLRALSHEDGTISGAIACVADITDSAVMREALKQRATFDELTGCYNRASIMLALEGYLAGAQRGDERAVMFVDLDRFKAVNDRYGHGAGDEMLTVLAARLRDAVRADDLVGRIGGDEFLVLCPNIGGAEQAMALAARLTDTLSEDVELATATISHKISVGVAWSDAQNTNADELVARADEAMYESKRERAGRPQLAQDVAAIATRDSDARHAAGAAR
jgi:diguanylate cyclase (GGDEF)-like protein/PAS domain S-box-containing protein